MALLLTKAGCYAASQETHLSYHSMIASDTPSIMLPSMRNAYFSSLEVGGFLSSFL
jgi:hypothetical protein